MSRGGGAGVALLILLAGGLAYLNAPERVTLRLGLVTLRGVSLAAVLFGAVLLGMAGMLLVGIRNDLRVRRLLREKLLEGRGEEPGE